MEQAMDARQHSRSKARLRRRDVDARAPNAMTATNAARPRRAYGGSLNFKGAQESYPARSSNFSPLAQISERIGAPEAARQGTRTSPEELGKRIPRTPRVAAAAPSPSSAPGTSSRSSRRARAGG